MGRLYIKISIQTTGPAEIRDKHSLPLKLWVRVSPLKVKFQTTSEDDLMKILTWAYAWNVGHFLQDVGCAASSFPSYAMLTLPNFMAAKIKFEESNVTDKEHSLVWKPNLHFFEFPYTVCRFSAPSSPPPLSTSQIIYFETWNEARKILIYCQKCLFPSHWNLLHLVDFLCVCFYG